MTALPYVTAPGNVTKALNGIKSAATPERVSQDFVKTILNISGGSGDQMTSYLKKVGFAGSDGIPTDIYRRFRNESSAGLACAESLKLGYRPLFEKNEYCFKLKDEDLKGLIVEVTGQAADSQAVTCTLSCLKNLRNFADFSVSPNGIVSTVEIDDTLPPIQKANFTPSAEGARVGLRLSYTINLNLPATSDVAVFNAIFKSLKENLLVE
jgi:Family of unknown function (DUF5343)